MTKCKTSPLYQFFVSNLFCTHSILSELQAGTHPMLHSSFSFLSFARSWPSRVLGGNVSLHVFVRLLLFLLISRSRRVRASTFSFFPFSFSLLGVVVPWSLACPQMGFESTVFDKRKSEKHYFSLTPRSMSPTQSRCIQDWFLRGYISNVSPVFWVISMPGPSEGDWSIHTRW